MGIAPEALEEAVHLVMHHRMARDPVIEVGLLGRGRQFAVEQEIAGLEEVAMLGELLDRVAAIEKDALIAVDIGDLRLAGGGRGEARIVGEHAGLGIELRDVDDARPDRAGPHRQLDLLVVSDERARCAVHDVHAFRRRPALHEASWITPSDGDRSAIPPHPSVQALPELSGFGIVLLHCIQARRKGSCERLAARRHDLVPKPCEALVAP